MGATEIIYALILIIWGINLYELRGLRVDNRELSKTISALSVTISQLSTEVSHKVSGVDCATFRLGLKNGQ